MYPGADGGYADGMTNLDTEELIELYAAPEQLEADRIIQMLAEDGVEALARVTASSTFPVEGAVFVLVAAHDVDKARATIENARREGAISDGGEFQVR